MPRAFDLGVSASVLARHSSLDTRHFLTTRHTRAAATPARSFTCAQFPSHTRVGVCTPLLLPCFLQEFHSKGVSLWGSRKNIIPRPLGAFRVCSGGSLDPCFCLFGVRRLDAAFALLQQARQGAHGSLGTEVQVSFGLSRRGGAGVRWSARGVCLPRFAVLPRQFRSARNSSARLPKPRRSALAGRPGTF